MQNNLSEMPDEKLEELVRRSRQELSAQNALMDEKYATLVERTLNMDAPSDEESELKKEQAKIAGELDSKLNEIVVGLATDEELDE